jgi:hypothetical protein
MTTVSSIGGRNRPAQEPRPSAPPAAVAWINGRMAIVATIERDGQISTCTVDRGLETEASYLAIVVRVIGDRERVVILGPSSVRLALERAYVSMYRRPERLVDVEEAAALDEAGVVARLRELAAWDAR